MVYYRVYAEFPTASEYYTLYGYDEQFTDEADAEQSYEECIADGCLYCTMSRTEIYNHREYETFGMKEFYRD